MHSLFIFFIIASNYVSDDKKNDADKSISRVIEIDVFEEARDSIIAESISDDSFIEEILQMEDTTKTFTQKERLDFEAKKESEKARIAKINNAEKERKKAEKEKIKKENKRIEDKVKQAQKKLAKEKADLIKKMKEDEDKKKRKKEKQEEQKKERELNAKKERERNARIKENNRIKADKEWTHSAEGIMEFKRYGNAIKNKVYGKWIKPSNAKAGWQCKMTIIQDEKGYVKNIKNLSCNPENKSLQDSVKKAVKESSPLPLSRDSRLFDQEMVINFIVE